MLNWLPRDFSSLLSILFCVKLYRGWVGQFQVSLKTKTQNVRVGGVEEMKISFLQHPQGLLEIQKMPPRHPPTSSVDEVQVSDTFCFLTYLCLCFILISYFSVKAEQILHGFSLVHKGHPLCQLLCK